MKKIFSLVVALMMALTVCSFAAAENTVSTDGSTSMEKVVGALGEYFMEQNPGVTFTYNPTGSGSGITAVQEGRCDIGLSSRSLKDEEKAAGLVETVVAYDGIAIIVHPDNPVADLSVETIGKIYTGEITNWKDVGGNGQHGFFDRLSRRRVPAAAGTLLIHFCTASSAGATAPAAAMSSAASAEVAKSKNFCAVSDRGTPSRVTKTKGRCTT